jgi:hypothetical protein
MSETEDKNNNITDIFTKSNFIFILWFLAIYFILYFVLGIFFNKKDGSGSETGALRVTRMLDGIIFLFVLIYIVTLVANNSYEEMSKIFEEWFDNTIDFIDNPYSIFSVTIFILVFYSIIYLIRIPMTYDMKPVSIMLIETIAIIIFVILLIFNFFKYVLKIGLIKSLIDKPKPTATPAPTCPNINVATATATATPKPDKEVFNIQNNLYTYDEAQDVCSIYGATLANYDQMEKAYQDGAEWCNYGWSENQMALFPTQKETWNKLQKSEKTKNACGRPGINGGYIKEKNMKYGVNCYGKKPKASDKDLQIMKANIEDKIPESDADRDLRIKMEIWKANADKFLVVNSFNKGKWSVF